jgi:hypothetical protein
MTCSDIRIMMSDSLLQNNNVIIDLLLKHWNYGVFCLHETIKTLSQINFKVQFLQETVKSHSAGNNGCFHTCFFLTYVRDNSWRNVWGSPSQSNIKSLHFNC